MLCYSDLMYNKGFWIEEPFGNNEFSYRKRKVKKIFVPALIESNLNQINLSEKEAFVEIDENDLEKISYGLENFIKYKNIYLFDNHNHCYYFYKKYLREIKHESLSFVHIDQHKDMRKPEKYLCEFLESQKYNFLKKSIKKDIDIEFNEACLTDFLYTNFELNVGNFIRPLLEEKKIENLLIVDSEYKIEELEKTSLDFKYVLDLDLDFFSEDMDYINRDRKLNFVKEIVKNSMAVFIATSPYFISFDRAKRALYDILEIDNN